VEDLSLINPLYQCSMHYFVRLFSAGLQVPEQPGPLEARRKDMLTSITKLVFSHISPGLFQDDKLLFSFLLAVGLCREANAIEENLWSLFLSGSSLVGKEELPPNLSSELLSGG